MAEDNDAEVGLNHDEKQASRGAVCSTEDCTNLR